MFGLGPMELTIILIIILIIFGAGRLPEIGSGIGKGIRNFKKSVSETENEKIEEDKEKSSDE
ncbi:MAG: twin-arginine translocase TatA/TatE family subunit [Desulfobacterales bacterium]|nr:twin-arginine translocase TatA/TatE family subunit [Desulfobacterales bacterium]